MSDPVQPQPRSEAQIEASRRNGAMSQGPVTEEGKARSAQNAVRHGVCAADPVGLEADWEVFGAIMADIEARLRPASPIEQHWVREIGHVIWRQRRLAALETAVIEALMAPSQDGPRLPSLNTLMRYRARLRRELEDAYAELEGAQRMRRTAKARAEEMAAERRRLAQRAARASLDPQIAGMNEPGPSGTPTFGTAYPRHDMGPAAASIAAIRINGTNEPRPQAV